MASKKILIGVTGGIAAFKAPILVRLFVKAGHQVRVIATTSAFNFVTPLTLSTVSKNSVESEFFDEKGNWNNHVELGLWADVFMIAPATANTIAKMANGVCDNLLTATYLSARCPIILAPAMDLDMLQHPAVQNNLKTISSYGNQIIEPADGDLASGLEGKGRMAEPEEIFNYISELLNA